MNFNDFLIIYLACGAPFGVYYFFEKRNSLRQNRLWLRAFSVFLFWIPFALLILVRNNKKPKPYVKEFAEIQSLDAEPENKIFTIQKEFEKILLKSNLNISIYEFREVAERYIGLTLAKQNEEHNTKKEKIESEIFTISSNGNNKISSICFYRRNRNRLSFHQKNARRDFLKVLDQLLSATSDKKSLDNLFYEFAKLLKDEKAQKAHLHLFGNFQQTNQNTNVKYSENEQWKTEIHKPLPAKTI
jgi:hypothetical protein